MTSKKMSYTKVVVMGITFSCVFITVVSIFSYTLIRKSPRLSEKDPLSYGVELNSIFPNQYSPNVKFNLNKIKSDLYQSTQHIYKVSYLDDGSKQDIKIVSPFFRKVVISPVTTNVREIKKKLLVENKLGDLANFKIFKDISSIFDEELKDHDNIEPNSVLVKTINNKFIVSLNDPSNLETLSFSNLYNLFAKNDENYGKINIPGIIVNTVYKNTKLISTEKLSEIIHDGKIEFMWKENSSNDDPIGNSVGGMDIVNNSEIYFNSLHLIYIAQSHYLIPGFLVCGDVYHEGTKYNRVCGITEAVDYGD